MNIHHNARLTPRGQWLRVGLPSSRHGPGRIGVGRSIASLPVGQQAMVVAIGPVLNRGFTAEMEFRFARIANRPLTGPVCDRVQHADDRLHRRGPGRQSEPVRLADNGVPRNMAQGIGNLPRRQALPPQFLQ